MTTPAHVSPTSPANANGASAPAAGADRAARYKASLNLPKTGFAMKANLVQNEPASLKRWAKVGGKGLYAKLREQAAGRPVYNFHDGPPYANGSIHTGHMMNKCLKDFVVRSRSMAGFDCPYVPGWDCHGLPIEHKVMTELVESGKVAKLNTLSDGDRKMAVRRECRKHAEKYQKLHTQQMTRLLTLADYEQPYLTMDPAYEGATLEVLAGLLEQGLVYRALKPVHWSIDNQTALAEAELEYYDREDTSVYVDFEAEDAQAVYDAFGLPAEDLNAEDAEEEVEPDSGEASAGATGRPTVRPSFMIWTTTPWTLPANVGIAVNAKFEYALVRIDGNVTVMAAAAVERVTKAAKAENVQVLSTAPGAKLVGLRYRHPFVSNPPACGLGRVCDPKKLWSVVAAEYVTLEDGTGMVHTAPGHGAEDYLTGLKEHLPVYCPVKGDGTYDETAPEWLRGQSVWAANKKVTEWLRDSGHLFYDHTFTHSYPHDWRSKTPTIFRCTEQWFVSVEGRHEGSAERRANGEGRNLRKLALAAVEEGASEHGVKFYPEWGRNRMRGMLESRPDWCISRQRAWGLPIPAFTTPEGATIMTPASVRAIAKVVREKGSDAWFQMTPEQLLADYDPTTDNDLVPSIASSLRAALASLTKGGDILDVWFESGSSWNAVLRERKLGYPADLYLEGSDQHRGWFQLSLLPALGVTGQPPFKSILTHGFIVDKEGKKLSKSRPDAHLYEVDKLFTDYGVDVLRWWVASLSYENDVKMDRDFFNVAGESYRKVRNTLRFMLSNLDDFSHGGAGFQPAPAVPPTSLEAWVLTQFDQLTVRVLKAYEEFDYKTVHSAIYDFCNETLSAVYLAAVKDRLYCDKTDSSRRRRTQAALFTISDGLCRLLATIMCHTADEGYRALHKVKDDDADCCVHLTTFAPLTGTKADDAWPKVIAAAAAGSKALEDGKATLGVENPLDAGVVLPDPEGVLGRFDPVDLADLLGVSRVTVDRAATQPSILDLRSQPRCDRSWKRDATVKVRSDGGTLSDRDAAAVGV